MQVVGDRPGAAATAAKPYVDALVQEIRTTAAEWENIALDDPKIHTQQQRNEQNLITAATSKPATGAKGTSLSTPAESDGVLDAQRFKINGMRPDDCTRNGKGRDAGNTGVHGVDTLFFGGGTPSLCPPELVKVLIDTVEDCFGIAPGAEISMEMDPGTFDEVLYRQLLDGKRSRHHD